jgi:hypothetical protein
LLTAINSLKLILLITLGFLFLIGQGWLIIGPLLQGSLFNKKRDIPHFQEISLMMISGLIINYGIVLIVHSLKISIIISSILAVIGTSCYLLTLKKTIKRGYFTSNSFIKSFGVLLVCGLFIGPILAEPLIGWDARSIWFLHAKMIYFAGSFNQTIGWLHPSVTFSHVDYPNLVPNLAAQIAFLNGFWNEYLPKLSLLFILTPAVLLLFSFYKRSFSFLFLIAVIPFSFASTLWNGYMDGYITLYFALSMLLLGRYYKNSKAIDLVSSLFCLFLILYIKNEGELAVIAGILAIVLTIVLKKIRFSIKKLITENWKIIIALILILLPFGIWSLYKNQWGIVNDLGVGSSQSLLQFMKRIGDGSYKVILEKVYPEMSSGIMLFGFLFIASIALKARIPREILPVIIATGVYCVGIIAIYMITPMDLVWHLVTTTFRTIVTLNVGLYAACFFLFSNLDKKEEQSQQLI